MNTDEMKEVLDWISTVDVEQLPIVAQIEVLTSIAKLAETVKPVMIACKAASGEKFICRL